MVLPRARVAVVSRPRIGRGLRRRLRRLLRLRLLARTLIARFFARGANNIMLQFHRLDCEEHEAMMSERFGGEPGDELER
jgi:hypothetical protein